MTLSMYQASVPVFVKQLEAISAVLAKGEAFAADNGIDQKEMLDARLAPDMFALPRQIQIATDMVKGGAARLAGIEVPPYADDETSFAELRARIAKTIAFLQTIPIDKIDGSDDREIILKVGPNEMTFSGQRYLLDFVIPNLFFHTTTAYGLLRSKGVEIGKRDFLGGL